MLESALITHGSPTLARLKAGSLFALPYGYDELTGEMKRLNTILVPRGVRLTAILRSDERTLLYLYREQALRDVLDCIEVQALLATYGYSDFTVEAALQTLHDRLETSRDFPHEIGVFLGYPLADVIGFICNGGRNCLCSGCWKAYSNECEAQRTFARLNKCKEVYTRLFAEGCSLTRLTVKSSLASCH